MSAITVSVVVPVFNGAATLVRAVASALAQSRGDLEVLVVDDASTDETAAVAETLAAGDPRVRLLRQPANGGPSAARNRGLRAARGPWIALLDADDAWRPDRLEILLDRADEADLVADDLILCQPDGSRAPMIGRLDRPVTVDLADFLLNNLDDPGRPRVAYGFLKPMIRRAFVEAHGLAYDETARFAEDFRFAADCLIRGARFVLVPEALYEYTIRADSLTATHGIADLRRLRAIDDDLARPLRTTGDRRALHALRRHARSIDRRLYWRIFIDDVKCRSPRRALATLAHSPDVFAHIAGQCSKQLVLRIGRRLRAGKGDASHATGISP